MLRNRGSFPAEALGELSECQVREPSQRCRRLAGGFQGGSLEQHPCLTVSSTELCSDGVAHVPAPQRHTTPSVNPRQGLGTSQS